MNSIKTVLPLFPLVLLLGCSNPAKDLPAASVDKASAPATNAEAATELEGRYFVFGSTNSAIAFTGSKVTGSHNGGFRNFTGEFKVVNGQLAGSGNKVVIDTSSLFADNPRVAGHLKSPDFFGVAQNPTATFTSTAIEQKGTNTIVTGDLNLHGVTKSISFPAKIQVTDEEVKVTGVFFINRLDFEIKYPGAPNDLIRKEVVLRLNIKAAPGRADFKVLEQAAQAGAALVQSPPSPGPGGGGQRIGGPGGPRPAGGGPRPGGGQGPGGGLRR